MSIAQSYPPSSPHIPVLLTPILDSVKPISGIWVDGTFGAGGYSRAILDAGADTLYAIDRDPEVFARAEKWAKDYDGRLKLIHGTFSDLDTHVKNAGTDLIDGVAPGEKPRITQEISLHDFYDVYKMLLISYREERLQMRGMDNVRLDLIVPAVILIESLIS